MTSASAAPTIFEMFRAVREHPDFVFGIMYVKEDFPGGVVPDDFSAKWGSDRLAETGNEYIWEECGYPEDPDEDSGWDSQASPSVFDLFFQVKDHPEFVFGTIFVPGDFPGGTAPEDFSPKWAEEALACAGGNYIADQCGLDED